MKIYNIISPYFGLSKLDSQNKCTFLSGSKIYIFWTWENLKDKRETTSCTASYLGEKRMHLFIHAVIQLTCFQHFSEAGDHGG